MSRAEAEIAIAAPVEAVWALVGDPTRWPEWQEAMKRVEALSADRYRVVGGNERRSYSYEIVVEAREPTRRLAWRYAERIKGGGEYTLERGDGTTGVRTAETLQLAMLPGVRLLMEKLIFNRQYRKTVQAALDALKERIEGAHP